MRVSDSELDRRMNELEAACRRTGLRLTHQRIEIFREVAASAEHPDAEAVYEAVRRRLPSVSLDTVYRTLWLLEDLGLIGTLGTRRQRTRFDANLESHHHFICERCGLVRDFESAEFDRLTAPEGVDRLGSVSRIAVEVRGLCRDCAERKGRM